MAMKSYTDLVTVEPGLLGIAAVLATYSPGLAWFLDAADMDGDGDLDVVASSNSQGLLAWFPNIDGLGTFGAQQTLKASAPFAAWVDVADFEGDGDVDILASGATENFALSWFKNLDGAGTFGGDIPLGSNFASSDWVGAGDLDGDGDMDAVARTTGFRTFQNTDGLGTFNLGTNIAGSLDSHSVRLHDLEVDADGSRTAQLVITLTNFGAMCTTAERDTEALQVYTESADIARGLIERFPDDRRHLSVLARALGGLGNTAENADRVQDAVDGYEQSVAAYEQSLLAFPGRPDLREEMCQILSRLAGVLAFDPERSLATYERTRLAHPRLPRSRQPSGRAGPAVQSSGRGPRREWPAECSRPLLARGPSARSGPGAILRRVALHAQRPGLQRMQLSGLVAHARSR
ncbi:MAG: hypothetical protein ACI9EF_003974 [Pseudohongiellaceae bacterium]|jgi:hypothetical protein